MNVSLPPRVTQWVRKLAGPRIIDPFVRVLTLIVAVMLGAPSDFELLLYPAAQIDLVAALIIACSPYFPRITVVLALALSSVITFGFDAEVIYADIAIGATAAVCLSYRQARWWLVSATGLVIIDIVFTAVNDLSWIDSLYVVGTFLAITLLGWAAGYTQISIDRLVEQRVADAIAAERALKTQREQFMLDAHDTVSHGLTRQHYMLQFLNEQLHNSQVPPEAAQLLAEIMLSNTITQQHLRDLLDRLGRTSGDTVCAETAVNATLDDIARSFRIAHQKIDITSEVSSQHIPAQARTSIAMLITEVATNMLKHGWNESTPARLNICASPAHGFSVTATNPTRVPQANSFAEVARTSAGTSPRLPGRDLVPASLNQRAHILGGTCTVHDSDDVYRIVATFPWPRVDSPEGLTYKAV